MRRSGSLKLIVCPSHPARQWWSWGSDSVVWLWSCHSTGTVLSPSSGLCWGPPMSCSSAHHRPPLSPAPGASWMHCSHTFSWLLTPLCAWPGNPWRERRRQEENRTWPVFPGSLSAGCVSPPKVAASVTALSVPKSWQLPPPFLIQAALLVLGSLRAPGIYVFSSHTFVNNPSLKPFQTALWPLFPAVLSTEMSSLCHSSLKWCPQLLWSSDMEIMHLKGSQQSSGDL